MKFDEAIKALKTTYSRRIFESYGYDNRRKKYTALEAQDHNNGDRNPSMALNDRGGSFYLKDFAGQQKMYSSIDLIMLQEGLSFVDAIKHGAKICGITIDNDRPQDELSPDMKYIISGLYRKAKQEGFSVKAITAKYHYLYKDVTGKKLYDKYRVDYVDADGARHKYIVMGKENNGFVKFKFEAGEYQSLIAMYGDFRQFEAGEKVYVVEGEKCVDISRSKGLKNVVTVGSSNDFRYKGKKFAPYFKDTDIVILQDNDKPGEKLTREIISALEGAASSIKVIVPDQSREKADIADFFQNGGTLQQLERMIAETKPIQKQSSGGDNPKLNLGQDAQPEANVTAIHTIVDRLVKMDAANKFATNDKGSAELFASVFKNVNRYNPTQKDWMYYNDVKWVADTEGMRAKRNAKKLADAILSYAISDSELDEKQRESYLKYASRLMNYRDRNTMVNDAKDLNYFENEELDKEDFLLNCKNCVLDLSGDNPRLLKHDADLLLSKVCNANYDPAATCELWKKTISEIMEGDTGKIKYLQKVFGLSLTGCAAEEELYFFYGGSTRNGKSTICETVLFILADYGATISPETLAVKINKDSRTASPDIAKLAGTRLVVAAEPPRRMIFDTSLVKTLTGRDRVTARFLHQNEFTFTPKFKLILNTNYLPTITDGTIFKSGRVKVINFNKHFGEAEQNKRLKDELRKEADGILNWLVEGLYMYRREGLEPPSAVRTATEEYETASDKVGRFISECLVKSDKNISAKTVYETYSKWCSDSGCGTENKSNFFTELRVKGIFAASGTVNGKTVKNVVKGYQLAEDGFVAVDENTPLPFD